MGHLYQSYVSFLYVYWGVNPPVLAVFHTNGPKLVGHSATRSTETPGVRRHVREYHRERQKRPEENPGDPGTTASRTPSHQCSESTNQHTVLSCWLGWLDLLASSWLGFVSQPAFAGHVAQKAASLALCAGFGLYTTCLVGVGWGLAVDRAGAPQRSGDGLCEEVGRHWHYLDGPWD